MIRSIARLPLFCLFVLSTLALTGCGGGTVDVPKTADQAVLRVVNALAENKPIALWQAMPESYQKDAHEVVHMLVNKIDPLLWDQSVSMGKKVTKVLKEKKQFILGYPQIAMMIPDKAEFEKQYDPIVNMLDTILTSELATHAQAKKIDIGAFLDGPAAKVMEDATNLAKLVPGGGEGPGEENEYAQIIKKAKQIKAKLVKEEGDKATVTMMVPGEKDEDVEFVRIEGKWIPKEMADSWKQGVADAKKEIAAMSDEDMKQAKEMAIPMFGMVEGLLGTLEAAKTQEDFNNAINGLMKMMGGGGAAPEFN